MLWQNCNDYVTMLYRCCVTSFGMTSRAHHTVHVKLLHRLHCRQVNGNKVWTKKKRTRCECWSCAREHCVNVAGEERCANVARPINTHQHTCLLLVTELFFPSDLQTTTNVEQTLQGDGLFFKGFFAMDSHCTISLSVKNFTHHVSPNKSSVSKHWTTRLKSNIAIAAIVWQAQSERDVEIESRRNRITTGCT